MMITNQDFIIVGQQAWDTEIGSNCKNIALELSKHNRVLYVNPPLDRITLYKKGQDEKVVKRKQMLRGKRSNLVKVKNNLWNLYPDCVLESINWIKSRFIFYVFNKWNNKRYADSIIKAIKELSLKDYILFNDNDIFRSFYLKDFLHPKRSIYYSRDYMLGTDYWKYHGTKLEPKLIHKSDLCIANSHYLTNYCKQYNPQSYFIGQGCDLSTFTSIETHELLDLQSISKPIIGYVGALASSRLDISLLEFLAKAKPNYSIVLIGPEDNGFKKSNLHQLKNVYFLGLKEVSVLSNYIQSIDVCINPQLVNEITIGNYPRKIDEYLALGKPVVAVATEAMQMFKDYTYLANGQEQFVQFLELALSEDCTTKQQERTTFALSHSWENCINEIYNAINNVQMEVKFTEVQFTKNI